MDHLVRIFHGGLVNENGEFENMLEDVQVFGRTPSFQDLVDVVSKNVWDQGEISLRGRFDCEKARPHYVLIKLESETHWRQYKDIVDRANVVCFEVVVEITRPRAIVEKIGDRLEKIRVRIESLTQGSTGFEDVPNATYEVRAMDFDNAIASDTFDNGTFEEEGADAGDDDDISLGSEDDQYDSGDDSGDEEIEEEGMHDNVGGGEAE